MFNKFIKRSVLIAISLLVCSISFGQQKPEMADLMRSNGKIYVVVAVCLTILIGLFIYMMIIDRKMSKLEKNKD